MIQYEKYVAGFPGRALKYFALAAVSGFFLFSCTHKPVFVDSGSGNGMVEVKFNVKLPGLSVPALTRAQTAEEMNVSQLMILVFESNGGNYEFSYGVRGSFISTENDQHVFRAMLRATENPVRFIVAANADEIFESYVPAAGATPDEVRGQLEMSFTSAGLPGDLPMWGEAQLSELTPLPIPNEISVNLLRAIARVDVIKDLETGASDFTLTEVHVFRANNKIKLIPDALAVEDPPMVDAPSIPYGTAFLTSPVTKTAAGDVDEIIQLYIPESEAVAESGNRLNGATVVVVGGIFAGDTETTYYRADFDPDDTSGVFGQVLRNYQYVFNIKEVTARGWPNAQDAADNYPSSLVVTVQAWEDFASDMHFGENRFAVSSRSIALPFIHGRERFIDVQSSLPYQIQWLDASGNPIGVPISTIGPTIANADNNFNVRIEEAAGEYLTRLVFRTLADNHTGAVTIHRLRITVENWTVEIDVSQENTAVYSNRKFNVMSAYHGGAFTYPTGHLGTTAVLPTTDYSFNYGGLAMRMILDNNFASAVGHTIRIGGFAFDQLTDEAAYFAATTNANVANMTRIVGLQDVIYLSYDVRLSTQMAAAIQNWLAGSTRRVLIVGLDTADSNAAMRNLLNDGTWSFGITTPTTYTRAPVLASGATDDFFSGPFGAVDNPDNAFLRRDEYAGYCPSPGNAVTPLLISTGHGMVFGVNKTGRIIYHGDANLFLSPPMSNNLGNVTNDHERLMANTWAWIVGQLIYGGE